VKDTAAGKVGVSSNLLPSSMNFDFLVWHGDGLVCVEVLLVLVHGFVSLMDFRVQMLSSYIGFQGFQWDGFFRKEKKNWANSALK
jgi:hypothetical protein